MRQVAKYDYVCWESLERSPLSQRMLGLFDLGSARSVAAILQIVTMFNLVENVPGLRHLAILPNRSVELE